MSSDRSVILICDHDAEGAIGVILNHSERRAGRGPSSSLEHSRRSDLQQVFIGGPVQPEVAVALAVGPAAFTIEVPGFDGQVGLVDVVGDVPGRRCCPNLQRICGMVAPASSTPSSPTGRWWMVEAELVDLLASIRSDLWRTVVRRQTNQVALFARFPERPAAQLTPSFEGPSAGW